MTVHFICEGNTYRSRLAEAYLNSLKIPGLKVISSGVHADRNFEGPISKHTKILLEKYGLSSFAKSHWDQLSQSRIDSSDIVVCVNRQIYHECKESYKLPLRTFIWDIPDINELLPSYIETINHHQIPEMVESTFHKIKQRVDELVILITKSRSKEQLDILNPDGSTLHKTADINEVHQKGLWHSGVHIGLFTKDGRVVIEKRSQTIIQNPGLWDLTLGGLVSAGESPDSAVIRETNEEIGVNLKPEDLQKLYVFRYNHYLPQYGLHNKVFVHTYVANISGTAKFKTQKSEVADARLVPIGEVKKMINDIKINNLGEMTPSRSFYLQLLRAIEERIN